MEGTSRNLNKMLDFAMQQDNNGLMKKLCDKIIKNLAKNANKELVGNNSSLIC